MPIPRDAECSRVDEPYARKSVLTFVQPVDIKPGMGDFRRWTFRLPADSKLLGSTYGARRPRGGSTAFGGHCFRFAVVSLDLAFRTVNLTGAINFRQFFSLLVGAAVMEHLPRAHLDSCGVRSAFYSNVSEVKSVFRVRVRFYTPYPNASPFGFDKRYLHFVVSWITGFMHVPRELQKAPLWPPRDRFLLDPVCHSVA